MNDAALKQKLESIGQSHVLRFAEKLDLARRAKLTKQLESLDLDAIVHSFPTRRSSDRKSVV